jgi:hypothetical protein
MMLYLIKFIQILIQYFNKFPKPIRIKIIKILQKLNKNKIKLAILIFFCISLYVLIILYNQRNFKKIGDAISSNQKNYLMQIIQEYQKGKEYQLKEERFVSYKVALGFEMMANNLVNKSLRKENYQNIWNTFYELIDDDVFILVIVTNNCPSTVMRNILPRNYTQHLLLQQEKEIDLLQMTQYFRIKQVEENLYFKENIFYLNDYHRTDCDGDNIYRKRLGKYNNIIDLQHKMGYFDMMYGYYGIIKFKKDSRYYVFISDGDNQIDGRNQIYTGGKRRFEIYEKQDFEKSIYGRYLKNRLLDNKDNIKILKKIDLYD